MSQPSRGHPRWLLLVVSGLLLILSACNLGQQSAPEETIVTETPTSVSALPTRTLQGIATSRPSPTPIPFNTSPPQQAPPTSVAVVPPTLAIASTSTPLPISVVVVSPIPGNVVSGNVQIVGSATHPSFLQYRLEFGPDPNPGNLWYPITGSVQSPVIASNLGVWNTTTTPDGIYQIRLRVFLRNGTELTTRVQNIRVRNQQPTPVPTATPDIPRPIASFTTTIDEGPAPLIVTFQNQSQGQINSYSWDFGDGGSSTQANPTYVYQNPGTYQATLRVTGPGGTSNVSKQIIVNSPSAPVADFTPSQTSGPTPLTVTFNNQSQGPINSVEWDFGDGSPISTQSNPTHTFNEEGTYNVILRVVGPGGTDAAVQQITVSDPQVAAPDASFQASQTNIDVPALVTFTNTSTGQINQYLWDFNGDGITDRVTEEQSVSPVFEYITPGTYTVRMTATGEGGQDTTTVTITAEEPEDAPSAAFTVSTEEGFAPLTVQFTNNTEGDATEYRWNFGNGVTSQAVSPSYTYEDPGNYEVELTAVGPGGSSRSTQTIRVQPRPEPPEAGFEARPNRGVAPLRVDFANQSEGSQLTYEWDFQSDGVIDSQDSNPIFTYDAPGQYMATLRVIDPGGQTDTASQTIDVAQEVAEVATDTPLPPPTLTHTPTLTPTATITLTPTATATPTLTLTPSETPVQLAPPEAGFTADPASGLAGVTVTFNNTSTGEQINSYEWDFNGDGQLDQQGPGPFTYQYEQPGSYEASLLVRNPAGTDTAVQTIVVNVAPSATPTFTLTPSETPVPSLTPTFTPTPSETPVPSLTPTFTLTPSETPVPSLTPTFTPTPVPSATPTEAIPAPVPSFTYQPPQNIVTGTEVTFTSTSTGQIDSYQWDFNGDGQIDMTGANVTHTYSEAATYNVTLTVTGPGGSNSVTQSLTVISPRPPQQPPQDERPLLVVSNISGNLDVYAYRLDGTDPQNLTNNPSADSQAVWSPDKSQVAFVSNRDGLSNIYVLTLVDGSVRQLTAESGNNSQPAWSPDGSQIAFVSDRFGDNDIFVMNPNGAEQVQRTTDVTDDRQPVWSPDGSRIAYVSDGAGNADIHVMNAADGSNQTQLTSNTGADTDPAWSPDGTTLAYTSIPGDVPPAEASADLYLMNVDGSNQRPLTANPSNETSPVWSPDGTVLLFLSDRNATTDVFRITLADQVQEGLLITPDAEESDIAW